MWRRWNQQNGNRGPYIGHPTLIETTVEEGYLETIPEVDSLKSKRSSGSTTLLETPFRAMPSLQRVTQQHREPAWSQPSPTIPDYYAPQEYSQTDQYPDISPVNSPPRSHPSSEEISISPIEPEIQPTARFPISLYENRSRIPQRVVSQQSRKPVPIKEEGQETRWDTYSGEPTQDASGKPSTVRPGVQPLEHQYPQLKERTKQILADIRERELAKKSAWANTPSQAAPVPVQIPTRVPLRAPEQGLRTTALAGPLDNVARKEPWKGYSGRTALVDPVQNDPSARLEPVQQLQRKTDLQDPEEPVARPVSPIPSLRSMASEESIKPIAPLKINTKSRNTSPQSSSGSISPQYYDTINSAPPVNEHPKPLQSPFSSPTKSVDIPVAMTETRADSPANDLAPNTPRTPPPPAPHQTVVPIKVQQMPHEPDVSRFSWTTYATTTMTESPGSVARIIHDDSPPPPLPPMPRLNIQKRPVSSAPTGSAYTKKASHSPRSEIVARKPVGTKARRSSGAVSELSLSKTLPQIPPEMEATDKIANLEAQLNALAMRRYNTTRIIQDLQNNLKKNAIVYDMWKRRDITDRISGQEQELQCITNEEHDIGLRLHRAQKKRDVEDFYEIPTGLWIRRVTS